MKKGVNKMTNREYAESIVKSKEGELLGLELECVERLIETGERIEYSFAHEICRLYDKIIIIFLVIAVL